MNTVGCSIRVRWHCLNRQLKSNNCFANNGAIRIDASSTIGNYILPAVIARYRHDYPQLPIELSVGNSQDVMQAVLDFRVDIGFIEGPCHSTEIISEPWLEDELVVFAAPTSPLARGPVALEQLAAA